MKQGHARQAAPDPLRSAMGMLDCSIEWDDNNGDTDGDELVRLGLDAVASALIDRKGLNLPGAAPLDEVLAELGARDEIVDATARLIALVGQATYSGLGSIAARQAESLREEVYEALDEMLNEMERAEGEDADE